jgi:hypothetical protein
MARVRTAALRGEGAEATPRRCPHIRSAPPRSEVPSAPGEDTDAIPARSESRVDTKAVIALGDPEKRSHGVSMTKIGWRLSRDHSFSGCSNSYRVRGLKAIIRPRAKGAWPKGYIEWVN